MGQRKNKDNLNDLEMAKKRNQKVMITDEAIRKVPRIQYKNIPEVSIISFRNWLKMYCRFLKMKTIQMKLQ